MRLYTRKGDGGMTQLIGGSPIPKDSPQVTSYGTIDELNSWIGYIISELEDCLREQKRELTAIQKCLFDIGTELAMPEEQKPVSKFTYLTKFAILTLEDRIDYYTEEVPPIRKFILPGGCKVSSLTHVARTMTRRAEREIVLLSNSNTMSEWGNMETIQVSDDVLSYINRLSDYFFALARYLNFIYEYADTSL